MRERIVRSVSAEILGYVVLAIGLAALLWSRIGDVDGFYLDEWLYVHASEYIWQHLPGGLIDQIPFWDRGPQRLYSTLLAPLWGPLPTSTAYTSAHVLNVILLVSAIVPTALLARRVIDVPALRVLAVALGTVVPWLMIGSHLLTENLAFPLYMWAIYGIVRCAEEPSLARQVGTLGVIAALTLVRLNLGFVIAVLFVAVIVAEAMRRRDERDLPLRQWFGRVLRREALVVAAGIAAAVAAGVLVIRGGSGVSSHYGGLDFDTSIQRLFGETAGDTWRTVLTYLRGVVVGSFVFPVALGFGVAFAGICGRLGRRFVIPSLVALLSLAVVVIVVSTSTVGGAIEERYVMYVYTPIAVLAVAGLPHIHRIALWLIPGGAAALYILAEGFASPARDAGNFFAAPAGAFWTRVVQHRLVGWEDDLLGWLSIDARGWLLVGAGLVAMLIFILVAQRRGHTRVIVPTLAGGLALCAIAQALVLNYGFKQELYGTVDVPGGIALSPGHDNDRDTWLDDQGDERPRHCGHAGRGFELGPVGWHRGAAVLEQGARFHRCAPLGRNRGAGPGRLLGCGDRAWSRRSRPLGGPAGVAGRPPRRSAGSVPRTARRQLVALSLRAVSDRKLSASAVDESGAPTGRSRLEGYTGGHDPRPRRRGPAAGGHAHDARGPGCDQGGALAADSGHAAGRVGRAASEPESRGAPASAGVPGRHALPACELGASLVWSSRREPAPAVWGAGSAPPFDALPGLSSHQPSLSAKSNGISPE